jgi:hypothetical protein
VGALCCFEAMTVRFGFDFAGSSTRVTEESAKNQNAPLKRRRDEVDA